MFSHGFSAEVEQLRRIWTTGSAASRNDSLSTLATAAASSSRPGSAAYQTQSRLSHDGPMHGGPGGGFQQDVGKEFPPYTSPRDSHLPPVWPEEKKRKRQEEYRPALSPRQPPYARQSNVLAPISVPPHATSSSSFSDNRSTSMPHLLPYPPGSGSGSFSGTESRSYSFDQTDPASSASSPRHLRISDLLSPVRSDSLQAAQLVDNTTDAGSEGDRRWSAGEISVIDHSLFHHRYSEEQPHRGTVGVALYRISTNTQVKLSPRSPILSLPSPEGRTVHTVEMPDKKPSVHSHSPRAPASIFTSPRTWESTPTVATQDDSSGVRLERYAPRRIVGETKER